MKILMLNTHDATGGAARAAFRISQSILQSGKASVDLWCDHKSSEAPFVYGPKTIKERALSKIRPRVDSLPLDLFYPHRKKYPWGVNRISYGMGKKISKSQFDIVHLHWVSAGYLGLSEIAKIKQPIVWTAHDMWPMTGGCHYTYGCTRHFNGCGKCPQLSSKKTNDFSRKLFNLRKKIFEVKNDITIVSPSKWLMDEFKKSPIYENHNCICIPNPIDGNIFFPHDKNVAKAILRLPQNKKAVLFTAMNSTTDLRKGSQYLPDVFSELDRYFSDDELEIIVLGSSHGNIKSKFKVNYLGKLQDDLSQALVYSACDATISPSVQDNLPNVVIESLSCGTPVVAFNIGGMPDMINHKTSGYLAQPFSSKDLADGIHYVLSRTDNSLNENARSCAVEHYSPQTISRQYIRLYETILQHQQI